LIENILISKLENEFFFGKIIIIRFCQCDNCSSDEEELFCHLITCFESECMFRQSALAWSISLLRSVG
jgi:hypothetical protein